MRKFSLLVFLILFFLTPNVARAAVVTIDENGRSTWNVLSAVDELGRNSNINITYLANGYSGSDGEVSLEKEGDDVVLSVTRDGTTRRADVSGLTTDIVEIEEHETPEKIRIMLATDGGFKLYHKGVVADTSYAISVNTGEKTFSVKTPTGDRIIAVLPSEATDVLEKARIITVYDEGGVSLIETEKGDLVYEIIGKKNYGVGNYFNLSAPVVSQVSAVTGEVVSVDRPIWISVVGGLLG